MEGKKLSDILFVLKFFIFNVNDIILECVDKYYDVFVKVKEFKFERVFSEGLWFKFNLNEKYDYCYNIDLKEGFWVIFELCLYKELWFIGKEIEDIIEEVIVGYICENIWFVLEEMFFCF